MSNQPNSEERRKFQRILFDAPVRLRIAATGCDSSLIDISLKGALLREAQGCPSEQGAEATLSIQLDAENSIEMVGHIRHREQSRIGFQCDHIDMDSITHLRRLVELNLGDSELLERELEQLG